MTCIDVSQAAQVDPPVPVRAHHPVGNAPLDEPGRVDSPLTWPSATSSLVLTDFWFCFWLVFYRLAVITLFVMAIASAVDR
jgi:hypothetical protein